MGCGLAFTGTITEDGAPVLTVENGGRGGCYRYGGVGTDWSGWREAGNAFEASAKDWNAGNEFAGFEDGDAFTEHLIAVAILNRKRTVVFLLDREDFFEDGAYRTLPASVPRAEAIAHIATTYAARNARIWDRGLSEFVHLE